MRLAPLQIAFTLKFLNDLKIEHNESLIRIMNPGDNHELLVMLQIYEQEYSESGNNFSYHDGSVNQFL
jgi:hypothetical protein